MKYGPNSRYRSRIERIVSRVQGILHWLRTTLRTRKKSISPRSLLLSVLALVLGGALCCQIVWQHVQVARLNYQITQLSQQNHELRMNVHRNQVAVSRLERLDRIERIAVTQLGMKPADSIPVMELEKSQWVQLPSEGGGDTVTR